MVVIGLSWLVAWLLNVVFAVSLDKTLLVTALLFIALGLLVGERPWNRSP